MSSYSPAALAAIHQLKNLPTKILRRLIAADQASWPPTQQDWLNAGADTASVAAFMHELAEKNLDGIEHFLSSNKITILPETRPEFPKLLREIHSCPPLLYVRGNPEVLQRPGLGVVGTRRPTPYGLQSTNLLIKPVVRAGIVITSGLAFGIDAIAHRIALDAGSPTIAVLGCGIDRIYPFEHRALADDIVEHGGAVITEFPVGSAPLRQHFPQRNRIISGLSRGIVLIEAGEKSGALITAKFAADQNREVFALPGPIISPQSIGPNNWLKLGATPATKADDILQLFALKQLSVEPKKLPTLKDPIEQKIVELLSVGHLHIDEIIEKSRLDTSVVTATLSVLELQGHIEQLGGMNYALTT